MRLVKDGPRPREILSQGAIRNAVATVLASGGAATAVHHLQALAEELELPLNLHDLVEELAPRASQRCFVSPAGGRSREELEAGGGTRGVLKLLGDQLDHDVMTVAGRLGDALGAIAAPASGIFEEADGIDEAGLMLLRGNLAPQGAVVRPRIAPQGMRRFEGPARVFADPQAVFESLKAGGIKAGSAVVILGSVDDTACLLTGAGLTPDIAIVSNGGYSGLSRGLVIGFMRGGTEPSHSIFQVRDGDTIRIDLDARAIAWTPKDQSAALSGGHAVEGSR